MRPIHSDLVRARIFHRPLATFVAIAIGGIGSATVIFSLASPPTTERSRHVMKPETTMASPRADLQSALASATPEATPAANMARANGDEAKPVQTMHKLGVPTKRKAQNHTGRRVASRGKHYYSNFARYFGPRFSAFW
jgi:hypothetical protein